jgi:hypothetical protein
MPVGTVELTFTGGIDGGYTAWVSHTLPNIGFAGFFNLTAPAVQHMRGIRPDLVWVAVAIIIAR